MSINQAQAFIDFKTKAWFHWGLNPGPSACKADVITATLWNQRKRWTQSNFCQQYLFPFQSKLTSSNPGETQPLCCDGREVKALDSKSNGVSPRRFEPCSQRKLSLRVLEFLPFQYHCNNQVSLSGCAINTGAFEIYSGLLSCFSTDKHEKKNKLVLNTMNNVLQSKAFKPVRTLSVSTAQQ